MKKTTSVLQTWQEANCKSISSSVGLVLKVLSSILASGKCCIILILIVPNSVQLKIWHEQNPELKGNIRDYASINELICLSNMENLNAVFIDQGIPQGERLIKLNQIAIQQMRILEDDGKRKLLK